MPQLPTTTVVTPCLTAEAIVGSTNGATSEWLCTSIAPGAKASRAPSIVRSVSGMLLGSEPLAIVTIEPPAMPTEAVYRGDPVPSTTMTESIRRSSTAAS